MSKLKMFACLFYIAIINISGLTDGRPAVNKNSKSTGAIISEDELIALVKYAMRMMASKINITLQATTASRTDLPLYANLVQNNSQSTTPTLISTTYYETVDDMEKTNEKSVGVIENPRSMPEKTGNMGNDSQLITTERPYVMLEQFLGYTGSDVVGNMPSKSKFGSTTSVRQSNNDNRFIPSTLPAITSSNGGNKEFGTSKIRLRNLTIERVPKNEESNVMSVPFEAIITFTRQKQSGSSNLENEDKNLDFIPTRDPPDDFPPYFETVLSVGKKTTTTTSTNESKNNLINFEQDKNLNPVIINNVDKVVVNKPTNKSTKPAMNKRQTMRIGEFFEILGVSTQRSKGNRPRGSSSIISKPSTPILNAGSKIMKPQKSPSLKFEEQITTTRPKGSGAIFQRQEIEEEEEEEDSSEEEGGSLGSISELLPLIIPILEDLSDPNTETDIAELIEAGLPFIQGISQGDGETEPPDFVGILTPIIASLSAPNRNGNGTVLQTILPLVLPLIIPFIGPIVGPIIQGLSTPNNNGGSSITPLIQTLAGPLSLPTEPGGVSIASSLISGVIASLSKDLKSGKAGGSDVGALVSTLVSGVIAGGSTGISTGLNAKLMKPPSPYRRATNVYGAYEQGPVPASSVDTIDLVGTSIKDILGLSLQLVKSVIASVTGILGASSMEQPRPVYGPAKTYSRITYN